MPRRIRFIPPGSLVEVTCRTVQGRLLLRPSPILRDLTLGVLARAARLYPVEIHAFAFLSNHFHLLLTVADAQRLAAFRGYLNSNLAREAGRLIRWREKFWGRRYQAILVSSEEPCQIERLRYVLSHGAKEGLVASPIRFGDLTIGRPRRQKESIRALPSGQGYALRGVTDPVLAREEIAVIVTAPTGEDTVYFTRTDDTGFFESAFPANQPGTWTAYPYYAGDDCNAPTEGPRVTVGVPAPGDWLRTLCCWIVILLLLLILYLLLRYRRASAIA